MALVIIAPTPTATGTPAPAGTSAASATRAATAALRLGAGFIDVQRAPAQFFSIQGGNGFLGLGRVGHFDERESSRTSGLTVSHYADLLDLAMGLEQRSQLCFRCTVGDVADEQFLHVCFLFEMGPMRVCWKMTSAFTNAR
jgi:hypothetical protein